MISLQLDKYDEFRAPMNGPLTIRVNESDLADGIAYSASHDQLNDIMRMLLSDKTLAWMIDTMTKRIVDLDWTVREEDTLDAVVLAVKRLQGVADETTDPHVAAAIAEIRRIVGCAG